MLWKQINDICDRKCVVLDCRIHIKIHSKIHRLRFICRSIDCDLKMVYHIAKSCKWDNYIQNSEHAYQTEITSDNHIGQLVKTISSKYLHLRLNTYGKRYTREIINKFQTSLRHQLLKLILF